MVTLQAPAADATRHGHFANKAGLLKHAVEFMHDSVDQPLTALDLCAKLGVGDRMLRRAFHDAFGIGPLKYFRTMRMHEVHSELKKARGTPVSVADTVRRWGFRRLGAFAADYRQYFGGLPSETLGVRGWPGVQQTTRQGNRSGRI